MLSAGCAGSRHALLTTVQLHSLFTSRSRNQEKNSRHTFLPFGKLLGFGPDLTFGVTMVVLYEEALPLQCCPALGMGVQSGSGLNARAASSQSQQFAAR